MRGLTVIAILVLAAGCQQERFLSRQDFDRARDVGLPGVEARAVAASADQPGLVTHVARPASVLDPEREPRYLSLAEAVAIALEQGTVNGFSAGRAVVNDNPDSFGTSSLSPSTDSIRVLALDPAIAAAGIESALSRFDARWITSMTWSLIDEPTGNPSVVLQAGSQVGLPGITTQTATFNSSLLKPLPTGGVAGITFANTYTDTNSPTQIVNPAYTPNLQFQFEQPLLQGFGVEINQLRSGHPGSLLTPFTISGGGQGILITRIHADQSRAEFERNVHQLVYNVEVAYWTLYGAYWTLYAQEQALRQAYESWRVANEQHKEDFLSGADLAQVKAQYSLFRGDRLQALGQVLEAERNLRGFLGLPMEDGQRLVPADEPTQAPYQPEWDTAVDEAVSLRPDLVVAREELKVRQMELIAEKNNLLPDLRFLSTYEINSLGSRLDGANNDNALRNLSSNRFDNWSLGLRLDVPLGFRDANARVRIARLNLARSYLVLRDMEYRSTRLLTQQYRQILEQQTLIRMRRAEREAYGIQLKARFAEFQAGRLAKGGARAPLDTLLEAQRFWAAALSNEYQAVVDYNNALVGFEFAKGSILNYDNVHIAEGPLPACAQVRAVDYERKRTRALVLRERALPNAPGTGELPPLGEAPVLPALLKDSAGFKDWPEQLPQEPRQGPAQQSPGQ
jgi:outer membrane protein TolC